MGSWLFLALLQSGQLESVGRVQSLSPEMGQMGKSAISFRNLLSLPGLPPQGLGCPSKPASLCLLRLALFLAKDVIIS